MSIYKQKRNKEEYDSIKSLCFQYPCKYGIECSGYYLEADEVSYKDTEILNEASVDIRIRVDKAQTEDPIYDEDLIQHNDDDDNDDNDDDDNDDSDNDDAVMIIASKENLLQYTQKKAYIRSKDSTILRRRTYECSYASTHEPQNKILEENRRNRDSHIIGCPWHIILAFPRSVDKIQINNIIGEHKHVMNSLIAKIAP
ncbi:hypothetical protein C2G38_2209106 [Gigaspora rosea]|uniref:Uncharacterized protein n=1 Tax=Gigaspora rosea TaxID=44941 RepID=A0A397UGX0_9GLOM|nr:hypothetical protein C2G38_2209106 [Gigaspora rosea]